MILSPVTTRVVVRLGRDRFTLSDPRRSAEIGSYARLTMSAVASGNFAEARELTIRGALARDFLLTRAERDARLGSVGA